jgi:hypothetical protein
MPRAVVPQSQAAAWPIAVPACQSGLVTHLPAGMHTHCSAERPAAQPARGGRRGCQKTAG